MNRKLSHPDTSIRNNISKTIINRANADNSYWSGRILFTPLAITLKDSLSHGVNISLCKKLKEYIHDAKS